MRLEQHHARPWSGRPGTGGDGRPLVSRQRSRRPAALQIKELSKVAPIVGAIGLELRKPIIALHLELEQGAAQPRKTGPRRPRHQLARSPPRLPMWMPPSAGKLKNGLRWGSSAKNSHNSLVSSVADSCSTAESECLTLQLQLEAGEGPPVGAGVEFRSAPQSQPWWVLLEIQLAAGLCVRANQPQLVIRDA